MLRHLFLCALCCLFTLASSAQSAEVYCEPQLKGYYDKIMQVPEAQELVKKILTQGSFKIAASKQQLSDQFGAYWDLDNRIIAINMAPGRTEGQILSSILFEMHNAAVSDMYDHLDDLASKRAIDKENYVQSVERLEFVNSHSAAKIADKGIEMGLFPRDVRKTVYPTFEEHYHWQQYGGHSAWIANTYDQLAG